MGVASTELIWYSGTLRACEVINDAEEVVEVAVEEVEVAVEEVVEGVVEVMMEVVEVVVGVLGVVVMVVKVGVLSVGALIMVGVLGAVMIVVVGAPVNRAGGVYPSAGAGVVIACDEPLVVVLFVGAQPHALLFAGRSEIPEPAVDSGELRFRWCFSSSSSSSFTEDKRRGLRRGAFGAAAYSSFLPRTQ